MNMKTNLLSKIKHDYPNAEVVEKPDGKTLVKNFLLEGIDVEIMPNNSNEFTIRFRRFKFFDISTFEKYFASTLKYPETTFHVNSWSIYAYVQPKKDDEYRYGVFKYTVSEMLSIISQILKLLKV